MPALVITAIRKTLLQKSQKPGRGLFGTRSMIDSTGGALSRKGVAAKPKRLKRSSRGFFSAGSVPNQPHLTGSQNQPMNPSTATKILVRPILVAIFLLLPLAVSLAGRPPSDTMAGQNALHNGATTGTDNTAIGFDSMFNDSTGDLNTGARFSNTLVANTTGEANSRPPACRRSFPIPPATSIPRPVLQLWSATRPVRPTPQPARKLFTSTRSQTKTPRPVITRSSPIPPATTTRPLAQIRSRTIRSAPSTPPTERRRLVPAPPEASTLSRVAPSPSKSSYHWRQQYPRSAYSAGSNIITGGANIDIGNQGVADESNVIRIGTSQTSAYVAGIFRERLLASSARSWSRCQRPVKLAQSSPPPRFKEESQAHGQKAERSDPRNSKPVTLSL